ncbi:hypothetical protein Val02_52000 [Virgisporangium aliadipatigenens]|uniref:Thoeris protein ThsA Macro domain-containing protein n=1 Tax=Virgisporangium aliadipatigenens TaxID=741659 RepID=A0A8J3YML6_9ACTN|nr:macro domain-containing protein [Virgisporangium aliadipatigenens]GIJ48314.1 hypothetical protein Val02_52000 [Virgisporangium aliadipatigenens]
MRYEPVHYTIVAMDVAKSGGRDDQLQIRMRADLRAVVAETLAHQGLDTAGIAHDDLGDGVRLIVPARVTPALLLDPFVPRLVARLREHRKTAADAARLRLRMAVHMGLLHRDGDGWAGRPLVHCARLLDAGPLRRVLTASERPDLAVIVSDDVYEKVVLHGYGLDPDAYTRVEVAEKETTAAAWVHVPGFPTPPGLGDEETVPVQQRPAVPIGPPSASRTPHAPGRWRTRWKALLARDAVTHRFHHPDLTVTVRTGDLFDEDAHLVVGFTDTFDTSTAEDRIISSRTVQGQLVHRRYGGDHRRLDRELQAALARHGPESSEKRDAKRWGKLSRFPIGTVAVLGRPDRHVFAVAYARMGNDLVARSTVDGLWLSLSRLWDAVYVHGGRQPVAMPIIGSGLARIDQLTAQNLLKLILLSFVARSRELRICPELRVLIRPGDRTVDLREVRHFLQGL